MFRFLCVSNWILQAIARSSNINSIYEHVQRQHEDNDVSNCIKDIIGEIIEDDGFITDVILLNLDDAVHIHKLHGIKRARFITSSLSWIQREMYNRIYVMSAVDVDEFKNDMNQTMKDIYFNPLANFIIVLKIFNDCHHRDMENFLVFNNIYNVTILARDDAKDYEIYSLQSPVHACKQRERIVKITDCSSYKGGIPIFPKLEALRGCNFSIMTHNVFPLINLDNPNEEGIEQRVLRYFASYSGFEIQFLIYSRMNKFGKVVSNFSYTYLLDKVLTSEVEGAVGGYIISNDNTQKMFSLTYPLSIDNLMVILPRSNNMDAWHAFFNHNTYFPVILVFSVIILFSITAYLFSLFPSQHVDPVRDTLIILGYFLNKFIVRKFKPGIPETIIVSSLLFAIIIIPYTVQAFIWSVKTHPMRAWEPKNYKEVIQYYEIIVPSEWTKGNVHMEHKECYNRLECLRMVRDQKDKLYYTLIPDSLYETYKWMVADEQCNLRLYKLKEPLGILLRTVYFRRGSVLKIPFDIFYLRLKGAGLVGQHYKEIKLREKLKCRGHDFIPKIAALHIRDFKISYNVLIGGYFISAAVFAYEVLAR